MVLKEAKKTRDSNIELLRIIITFGVMILHYNSTFGGLKYAGSSLNKGTLIVLESIFVCSVNVFLLIMGYYLSNRESIRPHKIVYLIAELIVIRFGVFLIMVAMGKDSIGGISKIIARLLPNDYFVVFYVIVYALAPFINRMIKDVSQKDFTTLLIILIVVFSLQPTIMDIARELSFNIKGFGTITKDGGEHGYTIINFLMMYLIGAYIRKFNITFGRKRIWLLILNTGLLVGWFLIDKYTGYSGYPSAWDYCNPLVIIEAVLLFELFKEISINSKIINFLSPACFTCYLTHQYFLRFAKVKYYVGQNFFIMLAHMVVCFVIAFTISIIIYYIWDKLFSLLESLLTRKKMQSD